MKQIEFNGEGGLKNSFNLIRNDREAIASYRGKAITQRIQLQTLHNVQDASKKLLNELQEHLAKL